MHPCVSQPILLQPDGNLFSTEDIFIIYLHLTSADDCDAGPCRTPPMESVQSTSASHRPSSALASTRSPRYWESSRLVRKVTTHRNPHHIHLSNPHQSYLILTNKIHTFMSCIFLALRVACEYSGGVGNYGSLGACACEVLFPNRRHCWRRWVAWGCQRRPERVRLSAFLFATRSPPSRRHMFPSRFCAIRHRLSTFCSRLGFGYGGWTFVADGRRSCQGLAGRCCARSEGGTCTRCEAGTRAVTAGKQLLCRLSLRAACYLLPAAQCLLSAGCLLPAGCWLLTADCCLMFAACCSLLAACWLATSECLACHTFSLIRNLPRAGPTVRSAQCSGSNSKARHRRVHRQIHTQSQLQC